jgi:hypothetical protein
MEPKHNLLASALSYSRQGWAVLPIQPKGKAPLGKLVPHGFHNATTDSTILQQWWATEPGANIGIRTGAISGLLVLDIDPRNGGDRSLTELQRQRGTLPETVEALTGGGGRHLFFAHPGGALTSKPFLPGVDIKADGGYVVAPPSLHPSGQLYEWKQGAGPEAKSPAPLPPWLLECLKSPNTGSPAARSVSEWRQVAMRGIGEGQRNTWVTRLVGHLFRRGVDPIVSLYLVAAWNQVHNRPPLPEDEVIRTVAAIAGRELRRRQGNRSHG